MLILAKANVIRTAAPGRRAKAWSVSGQGIPSAALLKLSKDFLKLVLLAMVIAVPMAWLMMDNWLASFAYRIDLSWWMFAIAGMIAILLSMLTISAQAIKSAFENPIKNLRSE